MGERDVDDKPGEGIELSRRAFMKGAAATGVVIGADEYVKPTLKMLGVSRLSAAASTVPPPPPIGGAKKGCRPAFWISDGASWWNTTNDSNWHGRGQNPFAHTTLFTALFRGHNAVNGRTMWGIINNPGTSNARRAARELIAAYLNASYGGFVPAESALVGMWNAAVQTNNAGGWTSLRETLEAANGFCERRSNDEQGNDDNLQNVHLG